jgi:hypothetical protein
MITPVFIATLLGTVLAAFLLWVSVRWLLASRILLSPGKEQRPFTKYLVSVAALVAFPFAWFVGFVIGGNFGGAYASLTSLSEAWAIPTGIGLGIAVLTFVLSFLAASCGLLIGRLLGGG